MNPKTQKMRKHRGRSVEVVSMSGNGMTTLQGDPPVATLSPRVTNLLGCHENHQGELRKVIQFPSKFSIIKRGLFATCLNASNIKVTLSMRLDLLPHEARPSLFCGPSQCVGRCYAVMSGDAMWRGGALYAQCGFC
jgi:hypothetical protein